MSSNIETRLFALMMKTGDFSPILDGRIEKDTCTTDAGRILYNFITTYRNESDGAIKFPSLAIARNRFANSAIELPEPDPGDTIESLTHEVKMERFRTNVAEIAHEMGLATERADNLHELVGEMVDRLKKDLSPIQGSKRASLWDDFPEVLTNYAEGAILTEGIPWPWPVFTRATKGLQSKEFYVIAGRPKSRKTFVALAVAAHVVREHNARVLFISPEMPPKQILLRFIATLAKVRYSEFKDSALDQAEEMRLVEASRQFGRVSSETPEEYTLRLKDTLGLSLKQIPAFDVLQGTNQTVGWIESQIEIYRPDIVIVDSFYRLRVPGGRKNDADWKVVTSISRELKNLAMNAGVCVIGTHQLNREAEGKIGTSGNLALSDAVGQDADLILRVVTGKVEGEDRSALFVLDGREVPVDGVLINNKPCFDFSEIAAITNRKQVLELMQKEEDKADAEKEALKKKKKKKGNKAMSQKTKTKLEKSAEGRLRVDAFDEEDVDLIDE